MKKSIKNIVEMKTDFIKIIGVMLLMGMFACTQAPKSDEAAASAPKSENKPAATASSASSFNIDAEKSLVTWVGTKPTGRHNGTLSISKGVINVRDGSVVSGKFNIDMKSLKALDQDEEANKNLAGHLMSDDFFKVSANPTSSFVITGVQPFKAEAGKEVLLKGATHNVTGNLTMLGVTKSITFPAFINISGNTLNARSNFNIDRTEWGVTYGNDESLGDKFIRPTVNLGFNLVARQ